MTGLYTSVLCLLGYAIFGPSKVLVLGPDSSLGPMIAATILPLVGAAGIALVSLTDTVSTATAFASRRGEEVDGDKEIVGIGASNIAGGLFQGFPVSTSGSRTAGAETAGAKTQVTGLVGAGVITLMLVAFPALLAYLPQPTLGAVVFAASLTLADIPATRRLLRQRPMDFTIAMTAFFGVAILGVLRGILVAVAISVAAVFRRVWWPHQALLGQVKGVPGFHDRE